MSTFVPACRALVVEALPLYRQALADRLTDAGLVRVCRTAGHCDEARRLVRDEAPFQLLVCDVRLPDGDGADLLAELSTRVPLRVLLAEQQEVRLHGRARALGFQAYLLKTMAAHQMEHALRQVLAGDRWFPPAPPARRTSLTDRQLEVLQLASQGMSSREIASVLRLGESTVKDHLGMVFVRLGVRNRAEAVAQAAASGLLQIDPNV